MTNFIDSDYFLLAVAGVVSVIGFVALGYAKQSEKSSPSRPSKLLKLAPPGFNGMIGESAYIVTTDEGGEKFQINGVVIGKDINTSMKAEVVGIVLKDYELYGAEDPDIFVDEPPNLSLKHGWGVSIVVNRNDALEYAVKSELKQSKIIFVQFRS